ncbi:50S ribosomal protein L15 [Blattabacterium cuenoti]|uniref:50S ribosomal protein L15 n=1 Tax=Blattabacterium cuenoti TaxID=1653831 RepID=UPI00163D0168|nr:50S ribosomal protein L15 [Blattabacterium cuenoti]
MDNKIQSNLNFLSPKIGTKRKKLRLGRGQGTGKGGTCGRGHKGAKSRSGFSKKIGFEGGQMPLQRRIPKFGFRRKNKRKIIEINLDKIQNLVDKGLVKSSLNQEILIKNKIINKKDFIKILGRGVISSPLKISAHKFSNKASSSIKKSGGSVFLLSK